MKKTELNIDTKHSILVLDDEYSSLYILTTILGEAGYKILPAQDLKTAIEILKTNKVSAIISDFILPEGGGLELLAWVKEQKFKIPFLMISGKGNIDRAVASIQSGATDFICKPVDGKKILKQLEQLINNGETSSFTMDDSSAYLHIKCEKEKLSLEFLNEKIKESVLNYCDQNKSAAANLLKVNRKTYY